MRDRGWLPSSRRDIVSPEITIDQLHHDPAFHPRTDGIDLEHVKALQETPDRWPPLAVVKRDGRNVLVDGFHRLAAAEALGLTMLPIRVMKLEADWCCEDWRVERKDWDVVDWDPERGAVARAVFYGDPLELSFHLNLHDQTGRPLTLDDQCTHAKHMLRKYPEATNNAIALRCGLQIKTVKEIRAELEAASEIPKREARANPGTTYRIRKPWSWVTWWIPGPGWVP
jgi:hypothetical protein